MNNKFIIMLVVKHICYRSIGSHNFMVYFALIIILPAHVLSVNTRYPVLHLHCSVEVAPGLVMWLMSGHFVHVSIPPGMLELLYVPEGHTGKQK